MTTDILPPCRIPPGIAAQPEATTGRRPALRSRRHILRRVVRMVLTDAGEPPVVGPVLMLGPHGGPLWTFPVEPVTAKAGDRR
jgi:hypothetical protein